MEGLILVEWRGRDRVSGLETEQQKSPSMKQKVKAPQGPVGQ